MVIFTDLKSTQIQILQPASPGGKQSELWTASIVNHTLAQTENTNITIFTFIFILSALDLYKLSNLQKMVQLFTTKITSRNSQKKPLHYFEDHSCRKIAKIEITHGN